MGSVPGMEGLVAGVQKAGGQKLGKVCQYRLHFLHCQGKGLERDNLGLFDLSDHTAPLVLGEASGVSDGEGVGAEHLDRELLAVNLSHPVNLGKGDHIAVLETVS